MSEEIKAKRVIYKGICFRSKLEARWAVVFDVLEIKWIYEPETLSTHNWENETIYYRPDFYLPEHDVYVEVKPNDEKLFEIQAKLSLMVDYGGPLSNGLLILGNIPDSTRMVNQVPAFSFLYNRKACCLGYATFLGDELWILERDVDFTDSIEEKIPPMTTTRHGWWPSDGLIGLGFARDAYNEGWFSRNIQEVE